MGPTPEQVIRPELLAGERIVWVGRPSIWSVLPQAAMMISMGVAFAAAPYFSTERDQSSLRFVFWAVFVFAGFRLAWGHLVDILAIRRTAFAVTDRRALTVRRFLGTRVRSFPAGSVNILEYDIKADGSGSIAFRSEEFVGSEASGVEKIGFTGVQDVKGAHLALLGLGAQDGRRASEDRA